MQTGAMKTAFKLPNASVSGCKGRKYLRTKQVHNGSQAKKEWCEPLLSSLPCKLGSGKTRRKENAKEESTPMTA